jgi:hypothetical protein
MFIITKPSVYLKSERIDGHCFRFFSIAEWWFTRRMHDTNQRYDEPWSKCHLKSSRTLLNLTVHNLKSNKRRITSNVFQYFFFASLLSFPFRDGKSNLTSHLWLSWWAHDSFRKHAVKNEVRETEEQESIFRLLVAVMILN